MAVVNHLSPALDDIRNIVNYLADKRQSIEAAMSFFDELDRKSQQYSRQPAMGTPRNELLIGLRCFVVKKNYVVYYREITNGIEILRVLHGAVDVDRQLF